MTQTKAKIMAATVRASDSGLKTIDEARRKKCWAKDEKAWADLAHTSPATLKRFWKGIRIQTTAFQSICKIVGVSDWESVAEFEDSNLDGQIASRRLSFAIAGSVDEIDKHKLEAITALLRKLSGDASIEILDIYEGSIYLVLGGSSEGLERIEDLFNSGQLDEVAGIAVQSAHVLDKDALLQLIKAKRNDIANLSRADLGGANLSRADLGGAYLHRAYLRGANLSETGLSETDLSETDLRGANLSGADLHRADLHRADLSRAYLSRADLSKANLSRANLSKANLRKADLSKADLSETDLSETDLSETDLSKANLHGANLSGANLRGANVQHARFYFSVGLSEESVQNLVQRGAIFEDALGEDSFVRSPVPSGRR